MASGLIVTPGGGMDPNRARNLFRVAKIDYPLYPIFTPETAVESLSKAAALINQIAFQVAYIDRPQGILQKGNLVRSKGFSASVEKSF